VQLELGACLERDREAIQHAVRIELGDDASGPDDAPAVAVQVECAADGLDAGVVLDVRPPGSPRRYRYALDWRAQPLVTRPRLVGLAVAEAVDASRIELTAVPEPPPPPAPVPGSIGAPAIARVASDWTVAVVGNQRAFSARGGVDLLGMGVIPTRRLSTHLRLAADVLVEGATVLTASGAVSVRSVSSAPRIVYHAGGRLHGELGLGARVGIVRMRGEALPQSQLAGEGLVRVWLGPAATVAVGAELAPGMIVSAGFELGLIGAGATARDLGEPVATLGGAWASCGLAAAIAL
jgi:hypothetical protein